MGLFKKKPLSSQQKAQKAQMRIAARAFGCGWLVYVIIQMVNIPAEESGFNATLRMVFIVVFIIGAAVLGGLTLIEIVRNIKSGFYTSKYYNDDPGMLGKTTEKREEETPTPDEGEEKDDDQPVSGDGSDRVDDVPDDFDEEPDETEDD